jgi:tetratricopeptide (TPR) repeat protein
VALKDFNNESKINLGNPSKTGLKKLAKTYSKANQFHKSAETYEYLNEIYPSKNNYNQIGLEYSKAGNHEKALEYYKLAFENDKCDTTAFNYAHQLKSVDIDKAIEIFNESLKISQNKPHSLYELGKILHGKGDASGKEMIEKAYELWKNEYDSGKLNEVDYSWFPSCAEFLGKYDVAKSVRANTPKETIEGLYDSENLTKSSDGNLNIEF